MPRIENSVGPNEGHMPNLGAVMLESKGLVAVQNLMWKVGGQILKEMAARQTSTAFHHSDHCSERPVRIWQFCSLEISP